MLLWFILLGLTFISIIFLTGNIISNGLISFFIVHYIFKGMYSSSLFISSRMIRWHLNYINSTLEKLNEKCTLFHLNPLTAMIWFSLFLDCFWGLLEDKVLHNESWVVKLLGTHLRIQDLIKVKNFSTSYLVFGSWRVIYLWILTASISGIFCGQFNH